MVLLLVFSGCTRSSPYLEPIEAKTPLDFSIWRAQANEALSTNEWRWFDKIVQEHKYRIMQQGLATGSQGVDEAARRVLHGRPLSEVMREGLQMLLQRKSAELDETNAALKANEPRRRLIRAADTQMLHDYELHMENLRRRASALTDEVAQLQATFVACEAKAGR